MIQIKRIKQDNLNEIIFKLKEEINEFKINNIDELN